MTAAAAFFVTKGLQFDAPSRKMKETPPTTQTDHEG
jgi:hypothetical protein